MKKKRLDEILMKNGLVKDKNEAFIVVTEGRVLVAEQKAVSPAQMVSANAKIEIRGVEQFVGRGAYKLEAALEKFSVDANGKICADIGAATGGFTQVLLNHGAKRVYAIDTARGKLALKLRGARRVVVMEGTDVRDLEKLPEPVNIVTIDVSLISLRDILPAAARFLDSSGSVIALFKPQYEARDKKVLRHGIVESAEIRENLFKEFLVWVKNNNWKVRSWMESPIKGSKGNIEYLVYLALC